MSVIVEDKMDRVRNGRKLVYCDSSGWPNGWSSPPAPPCEAYEKPRTLEEYRATLDHYKNHEVDGGCSHGR